MPSAPRPLAWTVPLIAACAACARAPAPAPATATAPAAAPIQVMVLGVYHFDNPGRDVHNAKIDDVTTPQRQAELAEVAARLGRFRPTRVAVEATGAAPDLTYAKYRAYQPADLATKRNEIVQLGFRIAREQGLPDVHGVDEQSDTIDYFPYGQLQAYVERAGGETRARFDALNHQVEAQVTAFAALQPTHSVAALLSEMNDPARLRANNAFYFGALTLGDATTQAGAELNAAWYLRNAKIFAKLAHIAKPGDRVIVVFGAGHAFWLRHFVENTPGFALVEPNRFLTGPLP